MKHLSSIWRDPRISPYNLKQLTPMDLHRDNRWKTRDLPSIQRDGLWYPIMLYKISPSWWYDVFLTHRADSVSYVEHPHINNDGMIWGVKAGSNRWQCAEYLGYDTIDAMMFEHSDDCAKMVIWHRECNPLNNPDCPPYTGAWGYLE